VPRSSTRLKLRFSKGPVVLTALGFYQPSLRDFANDYRINTASSLNFSVSRHLALTAAYPYSYESIAVENRSSLNTNLTVGFAYSTGKQGVGTGNTRRVFSPKIFGGSGHPDRGCAGFFAKKAARGGAPPERAGQ